jgi:drug/metabolite transporter (DMT)-like permease
MGIWLAFWTLGLIWGSSFMLIRIGVEAIHPLHLVLIRVGVAAIFLGITIVALRRKLPKDWRTWGAIALVGIGKQCPTVLRSLLGASKRLRVV